MIIDMFPTIRNGIEIYEDAITRARTNNEEKARKKILPKWAVDAKKTLRKMRSVNSKRVHKTKCLLDGINL